MQESLVSLHVCKRGIIHLNSDSFRIRIFKFAKHFKSKIYSLMPSKRLWYKCSSKYVLYTQNSNSLEFFVQYCQTSSGEWFLLYPSVLFGETWSPESWSCTVHGHQKEEKNSSNRHTYFNSSVKVHFGLMKLKPLVMMEREWSYFTALIYISRIKCVTYF